MIKNSIQSWDGHSAAEKEEFIKRKFRQLDKLSNLVGDITKDTPEALDTLSEIAAKLSSIESNYVLKTQNPVNVGSGANSIQQKGSDATASGQASVAVGVDTVASGQAAVAEGGPYNDVNTTAAGDASHAEGAATNAKAQASHSEGLQTVAGRTQEDAVIALASLEVSGADATAKVTKLIGYASHAEGHASRALGSSSHAEGYNTQALVNATHAEGDSTIAKGEASHTEGYQTQANGNNSHAEGINTVAGGKHSHAEGDGNSTQNQGEHAEGRYNKSNKASNTFGNSGNTIHSVGIGTTNNARKNAYEIMQNGDAFLFGMGGYDGTNPAAAQSVQKCVEKLTPGLEHVTVKIRGCVWNSNDETDKSASVTGGKVIVKAFNPATAENLPVQEYAIPAPAAGEKASVVELDIRHGLHYQIHSEVNGLGASFRLVFTSSLENREVYLWNCSLGVWKARNSWLYSDELYGGDSGYARVVPVSCPSGSDPNDLLDWDADGDLYSDDSSNDCVLVSTADTSFLLAPGYKAATTLTWSKMNYGRNVPGLEEFFETAGQDWNDAVELAKADFDGALNSDKILAALNEAPAAQFATESSDYNFVKELPAAGALFLIYQNKAAINGIIIDIGSSALPQIDTNYYWSSSAYSRINAWHVVMGSGLVSSNTKRGTNSVLAVSAFHFYY